MCAAYIVPAFTIKPLRQQLSPRRRPRPRSRCRRSRQLRISPYASLYSSDEAFRSNPRPAEAAESYLRCVECSALYVVEPEELEGAPRVVGCSACLHEWYATEADLLWGEEEALRSLELEGSFEARSKKAREAAKKDEEQTDNEIQLEGENKSVEERNEDNFEGRSEENYNGAVRNPTHQDDIPRAGIPHSERLRIFVGNLSFRATEEDLYRAFSGYGVVLKCQVPSDSSGASKGYGFVEMSNREAGQRAIDAMQGASILGRDVSLHEARPRRDFGYKRHNSRGPGRDGRRGHSLSVSEKTGFKEKGQQDQNHAKSKHSREVTS